MNKKISTVNQIKESNIQLVRNIIQNSTEFTKHTISETTGLSFATTSNIINQLQKSGEVLFLGNITSKLGRPAASYVYNKDFIHICCIFPSSAGSQRYLFFAIYDLLGDCLDQNMVWLDDVTYESFETLIDSLLEKDPNIKRISIGIPGYCDDSHIHSCTLTNLNGCDLIGILKKQFSCEFTLENNMNAIAYGLYHARKEHQNAPSSLVVVSFFEGSGPGSGIIIDGKLYLGKSGFAGEVPFLPYTDGDIYDIIKRGPEAIAKSTAQIIISYSAILNPEVCVLTGENLNSSMCSSILDYCRRTIPEQHLPEISYIANYNRHYQNGLFWISLNRPYFGSSS